MDRLNTTDPMKGRKGYRDCCYCSYPITASGLFIWLDFHLGRKNVQRHDIETPSSCSGKAALLTTGTQFFDTLFEEIEKARHHVHIQFYIYHEDCIGQEMSSLLKKKQKKASMSGFWWIIWAAFFLKEGN